MTVLHKTTGIAERWGERLLSRLVPKITASAGCESWYEDCSCECHTICQRVCTWCPTGIIRCGSCIQNCRYTPGCSSC